MYPEWGGTPIETSWERRIKSLPNLIPPMLVFVVVVGTIYAGWATPTEAASLGVVFALILAGYYKSLSLDMLREAVEGTMKTTAMVMLIILAAIFLNFILAFIGLTEQLTRFIQGLGLGPTNTLLVIIVFYLVLGCFMETLSMLITTAPLITPIVIALGYDPVWFGILLTVLLETALITPPVGVNLYVVQGVRARGALNDVIIGTLPFAATMFLMLALLVVFPQVALWLPKALH
jgi:tripartite ATP-independent transporter DctM subunit